MNTTAPMQPTASTSRDTRGRCPGRARGIAVLLALIAVGAAVVLSLALASTRDQAAVTSEGIVRVAAARATSGASLEIACALVERYGLSGFDTASNPSPVLFAPVTIGTRTYSAEVVDLATNQPITADTIAVRIMAEGATDGVMQSATAIGRLVQHDTSVRADVDLSEFGFLTTIEGPGSISFDDTSTLSTWENAPLAQLREPVVIGSSFLNADAVDFGSARLRGYAVLVQGEFPETDEDYDLALAQRIYPVPHQIHVPESPRPGRSRFAHEVSAASLSVNDLELLLNPPDFGDPSVPADLADEGGNLNLNGSVELGPSGLAGSEAANLLVIDNPSPAGNSTWRQIDISGDLDLATGDELRIRTPTLLIVRGDLLMLDARIVVEPRTPFSLIVFGKLQSQGSFIGPESSIEPNGQRSYSGGVSQIMVYGTMDGRESLASPIFSHENIFYFHQSTVMAQLYAPSRLVEIHDTDLYGRALGMNIQIRGGSKFFYDPALNEGRGWSNPTSGLWEDEATPRSAVMQVAELTDTAVSLGTADDGGESPLDPSGSVVAIDPPAGRIVVPAHAAFVGGQERSYHEEIIASVLENVSDPEHVKGNDPNKIMLASIVRDFKEARAPSGHADFAALSQTEDLWQQIVQVTLDPSNKPVFSGNPAVKTMTATVGADPINWSIALPSDTLTTMEAVIDATIEEGFLMPPGKPGGAEGAEGGSIPPVKDAQSFAQWFRDQPGLNMSMPAAIEFVRQGEFRQFTVDQTNNPARGALFGDLPSLAEVVDGVEAFRSGNFTMEFAVQFKRDTAQPGGEQHFVVATTGDALVYVNDTLVLEVVSKKGNPMQKQKVPMERLPIANNAYGEIRIFYANRTAGDPSFSFTGNFPMWQDIDWLNAAEFTLPSAAKVSIERVAQRAAEAKESGDLATEPTLFADRGVDWSHRIEPQTNPIVPAN